MDLLRIQSRLNQRYNKRPASSSSSAEMPRKLLRRVSKGSRIKRSSRTKRSAYAMPAIHRFVRTGVFTQSGLGGASNQLALYQPSSAGTGGGVNGTGIYDIEFTFSLQQTGVYLNGTLVYNIINPDYSDIANLFDFYRIDKVEVTWIFSSNSSGTTSNTQGPNFAVAKDYNDVNSTTYAGLMAYQSVRNWALINDNKKFKTVLAPKVQQLVYNGVTSDYAEPQSSMFMNTSNTTTPHYGLKTAYNAIANATITSPALLGFLTPTFKYFISCKNSK